MKQFKNTLFAGLFVISAIILSTTVFAGNTVKLSTETFYSVTDSTGDTTDASGGGGGIINPGPGH